MTPLKPFNLARTSFLTYIRDIDEELFDHSFDFYENTVRWLIGNTLLIHEKLLFVSEKSQQIPKEYAELFSSDKQVKEWKVDPPSIEQLIDDLFDQQNRINHFDELFWKTNINFKVPYGNVETNGDLLIMLAHREAEILGKIKMLEQIYEKGN